MPAAELLDPKRKLEIIDYLIHTGCPLPDAVRLPTMPTAYQGAEKAVAQMSARDLAMIEAEMRKRPVVGHSVEYDPFAKE